MRVRTDSFLLSDVPDVWDGTVRGEGEAVMTDRELAVLIAEALFTNGQNEKANRIALKLPGERDGGGWCKRAAIDAIERTIISARAGWKR